MFVSNRSDFFFASQPDALIVDNVVAVAGAVDADKADGSFMIGIVGRLQFKVNAARIDDFRRVEVVAFGTQSLCVVIFFCEWM